MAFVLRSPAFEDEARIPDLYTCLSGNLSPPLAWDDVPAGALSFAITCEDPDAPKGTFHHWAIFDIPAYVRELPEGFGNTQHEGIRQAKNDFGTVGYGGPCPPPGHGEHHYRFRIFALRVETLRVDENASCREVAQAASHHIAAEAELTGTFSR